MVLSNFDLHLKTIVDFLQNEFSVQLNITLIIIVNNITNMPKSTMFQAHNGATFPFNIHQNLAYGIRRFNEKRYASTSTTARKKSISFFFCNRWNFN